MINIIQTNQQLFTLGGFILLVMMVLWVLQYCIIRYGKKIFVEVMHYWVTLKQYFGLSKQLVRLKTNHPKLYQFFWQRLHIQHFYGLPLTLLFLVIGYIISLYIGLVEDVVTSDSIVAMDYFVSQQMSQLSESLIVNVFVLITSLGSTPITFLVVLLTSILCWVIGRRYIIIGLLIAIIGSTIFTFLSKLLFHRDRPLDILLHEQTYSFPSGHATVTVALYGFIAYMAVRLSKNFARQVRVAVIAIFLFVLVGLSRIVLNEHYLSDVLGGYLVGALWLTVAISVTEWLRVRKKIDWQLDWSTSQVYLVWISIAGVLIGTLIYANIYQFPLLL